MTTRVRRLLAGTLALLAAAALAFALLRPAAEARIRARLESEARRLGLSLTLGAVHLTPLGLTLEELLLEDPGRFQIASRRLTARPSLSWRGLVGRAARVELADVGVDLPGGVRLELRPVVWSFERRKSTLVVRALRPGQRLDLTIADANGAVRLDVVAADARLEEIGRLLLRGCPVIRPGTVDGEAQMERDAAGELRLALHARMLGGAIASWTSNALSGCAGGEFGTPIDLALQARAVLRPAEGTLRADEIHVTTGGVEALAHFTLEGGLGEPRVDLDVDVPRLDFARLLAASGLDRRAADLGSASLAVRVTGPLQDPAALVVTQRLDFSPPARPLPEIERLRGPFVHRVEPLDGRPHEIRVSPESADFVALADVPPLFLRALLLGEDAGFRGHHGIDLAELPVALATNLARGRFARGASTIPQQLAKNLFLSRRKTISRKLEEASLALLLDAALGKDRELEIYLNVIEWGPGLYGLRPAARHYFGREPFALSPKQIVFLVSLVPGPLKYQRSFPDGVPTPFFEGLMATLLAKLAASGALTPDEYALALAAPLDLRGDGAPPTEPGLPQG